MFLLDHTDDIIIQVISYLPFRDQLRREQASTSFPDHKMFWALQKELEVRSEAEKPRALVCGQTHSGKTTLIDAVLDIESVSTAIPTSSDTHSYHAVSSITWCRPR